MSKFTIQTHDKEFDGILCSILRGSMGMEWGVTFWLLKDKEGFLSKEAMRGMYDGSVFYYTKEQVKLQKLQKKGKSS